MRVRAARAAVWSSCSKMGDLRSRRTEGCLHSARASAPCHLAVPRIIASLGVYGLAPARPLAQRHLELVLLHAHGHDARVLPETLAERVGDALRRDRHADRKTHPRLASSIGFDA